MVKTQRKRISSHIEQGDLREFSELSAARAARIESYSGGKGTSEAVFNAFRSVFDDLLSAQAEHEVELYDLIRQGELDKRLLAFVRKVAKLDIEYRSLGPTNQELLVRLDSVDYATKIEKPDLEFLHQNDFQQVAHAFMGRVADIGSVITAMREGRGAGRPRKAGPAFSKAADHIVEHWVRIMKSEPNLVD